MDNIIVLTQNLKLESLSELQGFLVGANALIFSTQFVFDNERMRIKSLLNLECTFINFSDILTDKDFEDCDTQAYYGGSQSLSSYYNEIKTKKNKLAIKRIDEVYPCQNKFIVCDDLGLDVDKWIEMGYKYISLSYYHNPVISNKDHRPIIFKRINSAFNLLKICFSAPISVMTFNGKKYLFYGSLNRIEYRIDATFTKATVTQHIYYGLMSVLLRLFKWMPSSNNTVWMSTLHESTMYNLPSNKYVNKVLIQDGYLPPNYPSKYLLFNGKDTEYYTWDVLGQLIFNYHGLRSRPMPFRKKLYLPQPVFPKHVKKILCVASGAGDWTAVKNRSDEDKMIYAFGKVAAYFPNIEFVYRCHPVWVHPEHQGVNSIIRAAEYVDYLNLPNFKISCNIPSSQDEKGNFILSYKRASLEEDLKDVDIVFGEHSVSMIDAAFKNILFGSVNVTGRRDFFEGITKLGFPHCESIKEIINLINSLNTSDFKTTYEQAIKNYNEMTDNDG